MLVKDFIDLLELKAGSPENFVRPVELFQINQIFKRLIAETEIYEVGANWDLLVGESTYTLPTALIKLKSIGFEKDSDGADLYIYDNITYQAIRMLTLTSDIPSSYVVFNKVIYFNANTSIDIVIQALYSSQIASDLTESSDVQTVVPQFYEQYNGFLEELIWLKYNGDIVNYEARFDQVVLKIKTDHHKNHITVQKMQPNQYYR